MGLEWSGEAPRIPKSINTPAEQVEQEVSLESETVPLPLPDSVVPKPEPLLIDTSLLPRRDSTNPNELWRENIKRRRSINND